MLLALTVYWITKPPSILWIDSGTMIAASASLGIPNPPGFPFFMMASHLFTKLPFGNHLIHLELFTIVFSLILLFLVYKIIILLIKNNLFFEKNSTSQQTPPTYLPYLSAFFATVALAFSYQYWSQSQNTEAFIFSYCFVALFTFLLIKINIYKKKYTEKEIERKQYSNYLFNRLLLIAFMYGLAAGANPTVAVLVPAVLWVMFLNRKFLDLAKVMFLGLIFAITLALVYSYLPIRASQYPFVNWGNPQTVDLLIGHLHGAGLNIYEPEGGSINGFTGSPLVFIQSVSYFLLNSLIQFTPVLFVFILLGIFFVFRQNKYLFIFLLSVPLIDVFYSGIYYSGNQESWFILAWIFFTIFLGLGFYYSVLRFKLTGKKFITIFSLAFLPLIIFIIPLNRSWHYFSSDYAYNLYTPLEKNAIIIGTGDFFNSLSHYLHSADVYRPDVTPVTANVFYVNKWNRDTLRHATNLSVSDKLEKIIQHKSYTEYNEAMNQFIAENINTHPIYVDHLTLRASALAATSSGQLKLDNRFKFLPYGLSLKVVPASSSATVNLNLYNFKFNSPLTNKPIYLERNYQGAFNNILNNYVYSYEYLADWYVTQGNVEKAIEHYQKAKQLSPANAEVLAHLGEFYANTFKDFNASYQYLAKAERGDVKNVSIHFNLGIAYSNLGKVLEAKQEFESVLRLAPRGDPIIEETAELIKKINTLELNNPELKKLSSSWQEYQNLQNNFAIKIPPGFTAQLNPDSKTVFISNNNPQNNLNLNIEVIETRLKQNENIEDHIKNSPLHMNGILLDTQSINFLGYTAAVQIFGTTSGDSSQRFILIKNDRVWQFKVYPVNSSKFNLFYQILASFRPFGI